MRYSYVKVTTHLTLSYVLFRLITCRCLLNERMNIFNGKSTGQDHLHLPSYSRLQGVKLKSVFDRQDLDVLRVLFLHF